MQLDFDPAPARPGLHALTLLLEHPLEGPPDGAGNPPMASERAWLLIAPGRSGPGPAVRLAADALALEVEGQLAVRLESADGQAHRVRLRALTARGLRAEGDGLVVSVPAKGTAEAALPLLRAGAPRGSRHAVLLVAEDLDGPVARTAVLAVPVEVAAVPSLVVRSAPTARPRGDASRRGPGLRGATGASWKGMKALVVRRSARGSSLADA